MNLLKNPQHYALAGCLFFGAANVFAVPIVFNSSEYSAFVDVEVGDESSGLVSKTNPPDPLPLLALAGLANGGNSASASGSANTGQLNASSSVSSLDLFTGATAGAGFEGEFTGTGGSVNFLLDFFNSSDFDTGFADANLFVTLISGTTTLFDEVFNSSQSIAQSFILAAGSSNIFNIQLISSTEAFGDGGAAAFGSNIASAAFSLDAEPLAVDVPEPGMAWLVLGGLGLLGWSRRKTRTAAHSADDKKSGASSVFFRQ